MHLMFIQVEVTGRPSVPSYLPAMHAPQSDRKASLVKRRRRRARLRQRVRQQAGSYVAFEPSEAARHFIQRARAPGTRNAQRTGLNSLMTFLRSRNEPTDLPVSPRLVCEWIADCGLRKLKWTAIYGYKAGVAAAHTQRCLQDPTAHPQVVACLEGIQREQGGKAAVTPRFAVTQEILRTLNGRIGEESHFARTTRAISDIGLYGVLRNSEVLRDTRNPGSAPIKLKHVSFVFADSSRVPLLALLERRRVTLRWRRRNGTARTQVLKARAAKMDQLLASMAKAVSMVVHLTSSKMDQLKAGADAIIDREAFESFWVYLDGHPRLDQLDGDSPLFCDKGGKAMTLRKVMPAFRAALAELGHVVPARVGISFRAGGATRLGDMGMSPDLIKLRGRWSSDCFERYVRKSLLTLSTQTAGMGRAQ